MNNHGSRMIAFAIVILAGAVMVGLGSLTGEGGVGALAMVAGFLVGLFGLVALLWENAGNPGN